MNPFLALLQYILEPSVKTDGDYCRSMPTLHSQTLQLKMTSCTFSSKTACRLITVVLLSDRHQNWLHHNRCLRICQIWIWVNYNVWGIFAVSVSNIHCRYGLVDHTVINALSWQMSTNKMPPDKMPQWLLKWDVFPRRTWQTQYPPPVLCCTNEQISKVKTLPDLQK